ncbi:hypothetical protein EOD03_13200, partial [Mesorhizobium sp. M7A.T.Ca.TU.009.01.1.2]
MTVEKPSCSNPEKLNVSPPLEAAPAACVADVVSQARRDVKRPRPNEALGNGKPEAQSTNIAQSVGSKGGQGLMIRSFQNLMRRWSELSLALQ